MLLPKLITICWFTILLCCILLRKKSMQIIFEQLDSHSPLSREGKENKKTAFLLCSLPWNFIFLYWSFSFLKKLLQDHNDLFSYSNSETGTDLGQLQKLYWMCHHAYQTLSSKDTPLEPICCSYQWEIHHQKEKHGLAFPARVFLLKY